MPLRYTARRDGDVLVITAAGIVSPETQPLLRAFGVRELRRQDARAILLDLRACVHALTHEDLEAMATRYQPSPVPMPVIIVVSRPELASARLFCRRMNALGHLRFAFSDVHVGLAWAKRRREYRPQPSESALSLPR